MRISIFSFTLSFVGVLLVLAGITPLNAVEVEISPSGHVKNDRKDGTSSNRSPSSKGENDSFSDDYDDDNDDNASSDTSHALPKSSSDPHVMKARAIFEWIHGHENKNSDDESNGGFINRKQTIRRANQNDITSHIGVFASQNIQKGELLAQIPWNIIIQSDNPQDKGQLPCGTGKRIE
jgi:hypothetical protein